MFCQFGGSDTATKPRGTLLEGRPAAQDASTDLDTRTHATGAQAVTGIAVCGVQIAHITYSTLDPAGKPATATAALMVPTGSNAICTGARPTLLYAHGTTTLKSYDMADPEHNPEALLAMATFAAHGYIVVAPNYLGYDESSLPYHPYLNAEVQAADMVDGLRASSAHLLATGGATRSSGQLVIAGYSQGGHVAMATHKVIERDHASEFTVAAAVPMSGPYDLVVFGDTVTSPDGAVNIGGTLFMPYLLTSYQNSYGGIYASPSDVYRPPFDKYAPTLFPTDTPVATLMADGMLPNDPSFRLLFGAGGLFATHWRVATSRRCWAALDQAASRCGPASASVRSRPCALARYRVASARRRMASKVSSDESRIAMPAL